MHRQAYVVGVPAEALDDGLPAVVLHAPIRHGLRLPADFGRRLDRGRLRLHQGRKRTDGGRGRRIPRRKAEEEEEEEEKEEEEEQ
eukprot:1837889-Pyramimonas_sp.AAC.1